ncbi:MAG: hypothetical protein QOE70_5202 [Chthoniobacter sp.]|jgi:L-ascorbate metabolism protein UlaG (beta-lactamase superfamily)|nr:hypothetical protein [Chthoniobacter sp.]
MKPLLIALLAFARIAIAGLEPYSQLLVADGAGTRAPRQGELRITYLGVNGYQFEAGGRALLVDPYFTRAGLGAFALNRRLEPDPHRIQAGLRHVRPRVEAVLVTHAHVDHLLDVPPIMQRTGARLVAGPTAVNLAIAAGAARTKCLLVTPGSVRRIGPWTIRVFAAAHDRLFGCYLPFPGTVAAPGAAPARAGDWVLGEPLAFSVEAGGRRIYVDAGGRPGVLPPPRAGPVDLAILGVALRDSRERLAPTVRRLRPRYVLPSHQDDFFQPFDRGFTFGKLTSFPQVRRAFAREHLPGRLILLDYFQPWTLR